MRLLERKSDGKFTLREFFQNIPSYAILSHTWGADTEEVTFRDLMDGTGKSKAGYGKIIFCEQQAKRDGLKYFWVDTCCIDKSSSTELTEAINSMFHWYKEATKCYVFLSDISVTGSIGSNELYRRRNNLTLEHSKWFTRGWTLQELLAPKSVEFYSVEGKLLGEKTKMAERIHEITKIDVRALQGYYPLSSFSVGERMTWAKGRETKRDEDAAYSLLGIFDIHMSLIYGEGRKKALVRLRKKIDKSLRDDEAHAPPPEFSPYQPKQRRDDDRETERDQHIVVCYKCQKPGHYANDLHCYKCGQYGHLANDLHCYKCGEYGHYANEHCYGCDRYGHFRSDCPL